MLTPRGLGLSYASSEPSADHALLVWSGRVAAAGAGGILLGTVGRESAGRAGTVADPGHTDSLYWNRSRVQFRPIL